jgi:group I intron endonuclease
MARYGSIYKVTNKANGKIYVGQTTGDVNARWRRHVDKIGERTSALHLAIGKYGADSFVIEEVASCFDKEGMDLAEKYFIALYDCQVPNGYNLTAGGNSAGCTHPETRKKLSDSHRRRLSIPAERRKFLERTRRGVQIQENRDLHSKLSREMWARPGHREQHLRQILAEVAKKRIPVVLVNKNTGEATQYESVSAAARAINVRPGYVSACLQGRQYSTRGFCAKRAA